MNPDLAKLQPYPFEKLAQNNAGVVPPKARSPILLSIGEPKHPTPGFIANAVTESLQGLASYPTTKGLRELREACATWLRQRFHLPASALDPECQVLPVNGTREALFAFAQAVVDPAEAPLVLMPNPFYQIYEGAALLAGAEPAYIPCTEATDFLPAFDEVPEDAWRRCQLLYLCSPGNPTGTVIPLGRLKQLIELAERYDFIVAADECYSEIYFDEGCPPPGLLQAASEMGNTELRRCVVFHSLSKRSNAPGLRSGFVAGDAEILASFYRYRTYHGCAMPLPAQRASTLAWGDEAHVRENRNEYRRKLAAVLATLDDCLPVTPPAAGFYLWPRTPVPDPEFARGLIQQQNVTVLPGSYLSRTVNGVSPGSHRVRMALVPPLDQCVEAAERIKAFIQSTYRA